MRGGGHAKPGKAGIIAGALGLILLTALLGAAVPILGVFVPILVIVMIFSVWVLLDFRAGVGYAIVFMPLSVLSFFPKEMLGIRGLNPVNVILVLTVLSYVVHAGLRRWRDPLVPKRMLLWYLLPITIAAVVGSRSVDLIPPHFYTENMIQFNNATGYLRDIFIKPMFLVVLALLVSLAVRHSKRPERFVYLMLVSGWVFCILVGVFLLKSGMSLRELASPLARNALGALGMHANEMSLMLNMLYALTLFSIREQAAGVIRNLLFISAVAFAVCVLMTFSRAGFVGLVLINVVYFWKRMSIKTVIVGLIVGAAVGAFVLDALMERMLTGVQEGDRGAVTAGRLDDIWLPLLPYVLEQPFLPNGLFSILWSTPARLGRMLHVGQTHSAWLGGVMDIGLIGFAFVVAFLLYVRREFLRLSREHPSIQLHGTFAGGALIIPIWFLQGLTDDRFTPTFAQIYFWIALGILMGCGGLFQSANNKKTRGEMPLPPTGPHYKPAPGESLPAHEDKTPCNIKT